MPHRDYDADECIDKTDGSIRTLSLWVPLTQTDEHNGCMMIVPWQRDRLSHDAKDPNHMRAAINSLVGTQAVAFPLDAARPLRAEAGEVLGWAGNSVHWGSRCSQHCTEPRISLATAFRKASKDEKSRKNSIWALPPIQREQVATMGFEHRLQHVAHSMLLYTSWFNLPASTCPAEFWEVFDD